MLTNPPSIDAIENILFLWSAKQQSMWRRKVKWFTAKSIVRSMQFGYREEISAWQRGSVRFIVLGIWRN